MTIGSAFAQSKGEPIGIDKINPFANVDELGVLHHQEIFKIHFFNSLESKWHTVNFLVGMMGDR